tara:strand:- start:2406 stop:3956 length:1551 start_codon:yes stop_codon:yes gene_type:complete
MNVVFRVDSSSKIGTGHVIRCKTLARALKKKGCEVLFISRDHNGNISKNLSDEGYEVLLLPASQDIIKDESNYLDWLEVSQKIDADDTVCAIKSKKVDLLIVDHYALDKEWEDAVQPYVDKLMVIDDLANRKHSCDILLDQNFSNDAQYRYKNLIDNKCVTFFGPEYALLNSAYTNYKERKNYSKMNNRVLIFMGGSDNENITLKLLNIFKKNKFLDIEIDIVLGINYSNKDKLIDEANSREFTNIYASKPHLADLMARADIAIGAGGVTTWERMSMGLPSIVISVAENQEHICKELSEADLITYIGKSQDFNKKIVSSTLSNILKDTKHLNNQSIKCKSLVDGLGTNRIVEYLLPTKKGQLNTRIANKDDAYILYNMVNEKKVRSNSINSDMIDLTDHLNWFNLTLESTESIIYIYEAENTPIGQIRFDKKENGTYIDYSLDVIARGRGLATDILRKGIEIYNNVKPEEIIAIVKKENIPSLKAFQKLGFIQSNEEKNIEKFSLPKGIQMKSYES